MPHHISPMIGRAAWMGVKGTFGDNHASLSSRLSTHQASPLDKNPSVEYIEKAGDECVTYRAFYVREITEKQANQEKAKTEGKD